jgi:hypothetical protein
MPTSGTKWPFQLHSFRENEDIQLLTTSNIAIIFRLLEFFNLQDEIAEDIKLLFEPAPPKKKTVVIALRSKPEKGTYYAYTALLECDLCGVRGGFFAMFKSLSGNVETLTRETTAMFEFLNLELTKEGNLEAVIRRSLNSGS